MDISPITDHLFIASRVKGEHLEDVLELNPGLIISMILERRPPRAVTEAGLKVLWLRTLISPSSPFHSGRSTGARRRRCRSLPRRRFGA